MKKLLFLSFLISSIYSYSQREKTYKLSDIRPIFGFKNIPFATNKTDTFSINAISVGACFSTMEVNTTLNWGMLPLAGNWNYFTPFISADIYTAIGLNPGSKNFGIAEDGASPVVLNMGVTGGKGYYFLFLPLGINGTAAVSTDFKDAFINLGISYDFFGFSCGMSWLAPVTGSDSFYKSNPAIDVRWIYEWD
ncbi:MAG: hypothetical protein ABF242_05650 [Flavobacteriales bacterium]